MHLLAADDPQGHVLDVTLFKIGDTPIITMHMVTLIVAALLGYWALTKAAKAIATGPESDGNERYITKGKLAQFIELICSYLHKAMLEPVMGEESARRYLPYLLTVFFFILANNLLGLIPVMDLQYLFGIKTPFIGGTATGNLAVTVALALVAFLVIQIHGLRDLGFKGWAHHLLGGAPWWLFPIMVPVELAGHIIKPAALAIRLFANSVGGHTLLATLMFFGKEAANGGAGLLGITGIGVASGVFAFAIYFLELFVATLQAFIFMFLTAVYIRLLTHEDHGEHEHGDHAVPVDDPVAEVAAA